MVKELNNDNFWEEVEKADGPVLIDFYASWCGPCRMMSPIVDDYAKDKVVPVYKVNIEDAYEIAQEFNVMSIPTFVVLKDKDVLNVAVGGMDKERLAKFVKESTK